MLRKYIIVYKGKKSKKQSLEPQTHAQLQNLIQWSRKSMGGKVR